MASPKVATYDLQPEMSAHEVCDKCVERIESGAYDVIILNFANCDMVGHTGVLEAAIKAVETVDTCVGRVVEATLKMGGIAMITADHGCDPRFMKTTDHTREYIPMIALGKKVKPVNLGTRAGFCDIAATVTELLGVPYQTPGKSFAAELV